MTTQEVKPTWASDKVLAIRWGVTRKTVWTWALQGRIPKPEKLSPRCTRWRMSEILEMGL